MHKQEYRFQYEEFENDEQLATEDLHLLLQARTAVQHAYAPYSHFKVGAAALLENGEVITGSNQENASFPAGACAERSALTAAAQLFPAIPVIAIAVSYYNALTNTSNQPITPCGICRQAIVETAYRYKHPIRIILGAFTGSIIVVTDASFLLPLSFTAANL